MNLYPVYLVIHLWNKKTFTVSIYFQSTEAKRTEKVSPKNIKTDICG